MTHLVGHPCSVDTIDSLVLSNITSYYPIMLYFITNLWWQKMGSTGSKKWMVASTFLIQLWIR
jgi:hypothetical protein